MSKQPTNKFNKLIATAAGAAVVVSAVAPVAGAEWTNTPDWMKGSLQDLVNYGVIDADSTVNAAGEVTRGEVALYFARALKLDMENVENPGFADVSTTHKYYNAIAALAAADKMNGTEKGFEPDRVINRAEMASLIVKAFDYKYGNGANLTFTDLKGADWARNAIAGLTEAGIKLGVSDTKFAPLSKLTRQDTVGFLWKVMKDQGIVFAEIAEVIESEAITVKEGAKLELPKTVEVEYANGQTGEVAVEWKNTVDVNKPGKYTVTGTVQGTDLQAKVEVTVEAVALEIDEVSAENGKDLVIEFNKAVDEITAENKSNFEISVNNAAALSTSAYTVEVDEDDANKVLITLADGSKLANGAYVTVKVKKAVLDANLNGLADDVTETFTFVDKKAPTVEKVEVEGNDLRVTFDDYVSSIALVKANGVERTPVLANSLSKEVTITNGALDLEDGQYTVTFANVVDIANPANTTSFTSGQFVVSEDKAMPEVEKIEAVDQDTFKIVFDKAVSQPTVTVKKNGLGLTASVPAATDATNKEFTVNVSDNGGVKLYDENQSSTTLSVEIKGFKAVSNNLVGDAETKSVTLTKDTNAPQVETRFNEIADIDSVGEVFNIKFNEVISSLDASKIILTDKDGIKKAVTSATIVADAKGDNTILRVVSTAVQTSDVINEGTYKITLGQGTVEDAEGNENAATAVTFTKSATEASDISVTPVASGDIITIDYNADMTTSAINVANYKIDNKALPTGTLIYFDTDKQTVKIELPEGTIANNDDVVFTISENVVTESGAKVAEASRNQVVTGLTDNVDPTLVSAKKVDSTHIELTFSEDLATVANSNATKDDFIVKVNGVEFTVTKVEDGTAGDNKIVLVVDNYNVDQTVTVETAENNLTITDVATNTIVGKVVKTATK